MVINFGFIFAMSKEFFCGFDDELMFHSSSCSCPRIQSQLCHSELRHSFVHSLLSAQSSLNTTFSAKHTRITWAQGGLSACTISVNLPHYSRVLVFFFQFPLFPPRYSESTLFLWLLTLSALLLLFFSFTSLCRGTSSELFWIFSFYILRRYEI